MSQTLQATPKRVATIALGIVFALLASIPFAPAAKASTHPIDFLSYSVSDKVVSSVDYVNIPIKVKVKKEKDYRGYNAYHHISPKIGLSDSLFSSDVSTLEPVNFYLDSNKELGKYTIGTTRVSADYRCYDNYWGWTDSCTREYTDGTKKSFYIRAKSKTSMSSSRKGKTVTLNFKSISFNPDSDAYVPYSAKNAKLQVKSGKTWKNVKTVTLKKGRATVKLSSSTKKQYRLTYPQTSTRTGATSNTVTR